jgi:hypothetical protein
MLEGQEKQTEQRSEGSVFCKLSTLKTPCDDDASQSWTEVSDRWICILWIGSRKCQTVKFTVWYKVTNTQKNKIFRILIFFFEYRKNCLELDLLERSDDTRPTLIGSSVVQSIDLAAELCVQVNLARLPIYYRPILLLPTIIHLFCKERQETLFIHPFVH